MKTIDLGRKSEMGEPANAIETKEPEVYYPSLYINNRAGDFPEVGSTGKATIEFYVSSKSVSDRASQGKSSSVDLEVRSITFEKSDAKINTSDVEDEIEKGLSESEKETESEDSEESED